MRGSQSTETGRPTCKDGSFTEGAEATTPPKGETERSKRRRSTDDEQPPTKRLLADKGQTGELCSVYSWTTPLDSSQSSASASLNQASGSGGWACFEHWMAAFVYCDEVLVCDATDVNGILKGKLERVKIEEFKKMYLNNRVPTAPPSVYSRSVDFGYRLLSRQFPTRHCMTKDQGEFEISKLRVEQGVDDMRNWGSYGILLNNCQDWITELLKILRVRDTAPYTSARGAVVTGTLAVAGTTAVVGYGLHKLLSPSTQSTNGGPEKRRRQRE